MKDFYFMDRMEENVNFNLTFPYHIYHDKLLEPNNYNPEYPDSYHAHRFEDVLLAAYKEPKAFYLTCEDKKYYSEQEIEFINKVIEDESKKLDNGMVLVTFDLEESTIELLNEYKNKMNMTTEEAIIDILQKTIDNPDILKGEKQCGK